MARVKLDLPSHFSFSTIIPVRITDLNYGNHLGNDAVLSIVHEARVQYLAEYGLKEMHFAGVSLIMSDAAIEFRNEAFYGDQITVFVKAADFTSAGFDIYYKMVTESADNEKIIAVVKTGMVCFDYNKRKVVKVPDEAKQLLEG